MSFGQQPHYTSVPTHARTPSFPPDPSDPSSPFFDAPSSPIPQHFPSESRDITSASFQPDDFSDPPPSSSFRALPQSPSFAAVSALPPGAGAPFRGAPGARDSVASSLGQYGYPSSPTPPVGSSTPYRNSDYASSARALNPSQSPLVPSQGGFDRYRDDPSGGYGTPRTYAGSYMDQDGSKPGTPMIPLGASAGSSEEDENAEKRAAYGAPAGRPRRKRGLLWFTGALVVLGIIALAVALPVYFLVVKPHQKTSSASSGSSGGGSGNSGGGSQAAPTPAPAFTGAISGGDGSTVTAFDGSTFTYTNQFGGMWYFDPSDPFNESAYPQSWSKPLNESWEFGVDQVRGVNIGGWLVTEPFIVPNLYEPYQDGDFASPYNAVDEWTLTIAMNKTGNATQMMDEHYSTFITEQDFAQIAAAGLNWVRIPIPYWAIEVYPGEPFIPHLAWNYFLQAISWARKYGLRINMDLHTIPGSQNGWNHSGKLGPVNFMFGVMGIANAQRALAYIRTLTEFVSQDQYKNVVPYFGIVNEALLFTIGQPQIMNFYLEAYTMIRNITGVGEGNGPMISIHDGFLGINTWAGFLAGSDRIALDTHPYNAFNPATSAPLSSFVPMPCDEWGPSVNTSMSQFGFTAAGEWSAAINDCGKWVNGVGLGTRYEGTYPGSTTVIGNCTEWTDYQSWNDTVKQELMGVAMSTMDALQNWFYWTWKIHNSSVTGQIESPFWSYSLGLAEGWIPQDPRSAVGYCSADQGVAMTVPVDGVASAWMTGGDGAGTISAAQLSSYGVWPITSMNSVSTLSYIPPESVPLLPQYTPTGSPITMPGPTFTTPGSTQTADAGSGWHDANDSQGYFVPIGGCDYPDPWNAESTTIPAGSTCRPTGTAGSRKREPVARPGPTPPPVV